MIREGLIDSSVFRGMHPIATTVYFGLVIGITMFLNSPIMLGLSLSTASAYRILLAGRREIRPVLLTVLVITLFATLINGLFTHNGATVLFYIGSNRITWEAFAFGATMSLMLSAVIQWFVCFGLITTSDKMIYIFGSLLPVIGLVISMIFRSIPLLKRRFADIDAAQRALGGGGEKGPVKKIRRITKEISILIAWSLEASIDSADSMTARGYGLRGHTRYHLFRLRARDTAFLITVFVFGAAVIAACVAGNGRLYFYPTIRPSSRPPLWISVGGTAAFLIMLLTPVAIDLLGELKWKRSASAV